MKFSHRLLLVLAIAVLRGLAWAETCTDPSITPSNPDNVYSYSIDDDGTATDTRSGLMWKRCAEGQTWIASLCNGSATSYSWQAALAQAAGSGFAGYSDWRLPSVKELGTLIETCRANPAINDSVFPAAPSSIFWSGSPDVYGFNFKWYVNFSYGSVSSSAGNASSVRLVRGGRSFTSFDLFSIQIIAFGAAPSDLKVGETGFLSATASSGLPVAFTSSTTGICTVADSTVSARAVGTCTVAAHQPGDGTYRAAPPMTQSFSIAPSAPQMPTIRTITPGRASATLQLVAPTSDGGSAIVTYTATCTARHQPTKTVSGTGLTLTVRGLKSGVSYACTATASNAYYSSVDSAALTVTPQAGRANLTPILLLLD